MIKNYLYIWLINNQLVIRNNIYFIFYFARLSRTIWQIFSSFLIFCFYFTRLKAREISRQNMRKSKDIGHIVLETVRYLMHILIAFGTEYIPKAVSKVIINENMANIYSLQANDSIMCEHVCIRFIAFRNIFSPCKSKCKEFLNWNQYKNAWNTYSQYRYVSTIRQCDAV